MTTHYNRLEDIVTNNYGNIAEFDSATQVLTFQGGDRIMFEFYERNDKIFMKGKDFIGEMTNLYLKEKFTVNGEIWTKKYKLFINDKKVFTWTIQGNDIYHDPLTCLISSTRFLESIVRQNQGILANYNPKYSYIEYANKDCIYFYNYNKYTINAKELTNIWFNGFIKEIVLKREVINSRINNSLLINNQLIGLWETEKFDAIKWLFKKHKKNDFNSNNVKYS